MVDCVRKKWLNIYKNIISLFYKVMYLERSSKVMCIEKQTYNLRNRKNMRLHRDETSTFDFFIFLGLICKNWSTWIISNKKKSQSSACEVAEDKWEWLIMGLVFVSIYNVIWHYVIFSFTLLIFYVQSKILKYWYNCSTYVIKIVQKQNQCYTSVKKN